MTIAEKMPADPPLAHLDGKPYAEILAWLRRALHGNEALPRVVPGESPEDAILRHERDLHTMTRRDLVQACLELVSEFARDLAGDDEFVAALFRLAKGFSLVRVATDIHELASSEERFSRLPPTQQRVLLTTLVDMGAPLPPAFWSQLAARDPARFGVVAFSAIARREPARAIPLALTLPDDERIADALYIVLGQRVRGLSAGERDTLVVAARAAARESKPAIRAAIDEWISEQPPVQSQESTSTRGADRAELKKALMNDGAKHQKHVEFPSRIARLVPSFDIACT
jgi:hypothetical protein